MLAPLRSFSAFILIGLATSLAAADEAAVKALVAAADKACAECKADKSWRTFETATSGHDVMVDEPEWLRDILLQVA